MKIERQNTGCIPASEIKCGDVWKHRNFKDIYVCIKEVGKHVRYFSEHYKDHLVSLSVSCNSLLCTSAEAQCILLDAKLVVDDKGE